jgi:Leu/Phe-tRNA-protein transferase
MTNFQLAVHVSETVIKLSTHVLDHEHVFSLHGVEAKMNLFVGEHMFNINNDKEKPATLSTCHNLRSAHAESPLMDYDA